MIERQSLSYKDPAGFVVKKDDGFHRYITQSYACEYDHFIKSGLYQLLVDSRLMIAHKELNLPASQDHLFYKEIFPAQVISITYPFEWAFTQWKEMILTYIAINEAALKYGMILKDATPYNFVFYDGKCMLLDTLSFNFYKKGSPWIAYRQFCEEILAPLSVMRYKGPAMGKLGITFLNGLPLSFVSRELPFRSWFNTNCLLHIHLHAKFQKAGNKERVTNTGITTQKLPSLFQIIKNDISGWKPPSSNNSDWKNYYGTGIENEKYLSDKLTTVSNWLQKIGPKKTIDLGANTGKFSFVASQFSQQVIAIEKDPWCADAIYQSARKNDLKNILLVIADITSPSPGLGWENEEKVALLKRVNGDLLMALALVHHLCITKNIPFSLIAKLFSQLTSQYLIVEFVPKSDPKVIEMLRNREDIFSDYQESSFIKWFEKYFELLEVHSCTCSERKLFLWKTK